MPKRKYAALLLALLLVAVQLVADKTMPPRDKTGRYDGMVSYIDSLRAMPPSAHKYALLAEYWLQRPDFARQEEALAEGLRQYPQDPRLLRMQADALTRDARYNDAAAIYARLMPGDADYALWLRYAHSEKLAGRTAHARQLYAQAYARWPQETDVYDAYHRFLAAYVSDKAAQRLTLRHLKLHGGSADLWLQAADVYLDRNRPYSALHAYRQAGADSLLTAAIMTLRLQEFLKPDLSTRFSMMDDELPSSTTHYRRSYSSFGYRPNDWFTLSLEYLNDHVTRSYHIAGYPAFREEREVSAGTAALYVLPLPSIYAGGKGQYYLNHERWGNWALSAEQDLAGERWSLWWRAIVARNVVEYWEFKRQREYTAQVELGWDAWTLWNSYSYYLTPHDEVFMAPEFPWQYDDIVARDNHGYRNHATLQYAVLAEPELEVGCYALARGYAYESRYYSSPGEELYYGLLADYGTMLNDLDVQVSGQMGMNDDKRSHWSLSIETTYDAGLFQLGIGLQLDDDGHSRSRSLNVSVQDLSL